MVPALRPGDRVLVRMLSDRAPRRTPRLGSVVLVTLPGRPLSVKRLTEVQENGRIRVEGDNLYGSTDSRTLGALPREALRGQVLLRLWPRPGPIPRPASDAG
jgi:signal peptidase I